MVFLNLGWFVLWFEAEGGVGARGGEDLGIHLGNY
jgi:hypothetical protein